MRRALSVASAPHSVRFLFGIALCFVGIQPRIKCVPEIVLLLCQPEHYLKVGIPCVSRLACSGDIREIAVGQPVVVDPEQLREGRAGHVDRCEYIHLVDKAVRASAGIDIESGDFTAVVDRRGGRALPRGGAGIRVVDVRREGATGDRVCIRD
jgi:hypothetical protein